LNTKAIALTIALTAVTVVLNPRFSGIAIPSFVPTLSFQIWEITIFAAFFLLGFKIAGAISLLNALIRVATASGASLQQPLIHLVAVLSTLLGVYVACRLLSHNRVDNTFISKRKLIIATTISGIIFRLAIMSPFIYVVASLVGNALVIGLVPLIAINDLIVAAYSIPLGYLIADLVSRRINLDKKI
jgi:hypothetical protein